MNRYLSSQSEQSSAPSPSSDPTGPSDATARDQSDAHSGDRQRPRRLPFKPAVEPRRIRGGQKITAENETALLELAGSWRPMVESWLALMRATFDTTSLAEGWQLAAQGQIISCAERPGVVDATVPGLHATTLRVLLHVPTLDEASWDRLIDALAGEAIFTASLLAGEWPDSLLTVVDRAGVALGFSTEQPLQVTLRSNEVKTQGRADQRSMQRENQSENMGGPPLETHAAAIAFLIAERLARYPLLMMTLRGMTVEQLLHRLRQRRESDRQGEVAVHGEPYIPAATEPVLPLDDAIESFWGHDEDIDTIRHRPAVEHAQHALLRRLGPSPLGGRFPLVGLLASIYDHVGVWAVQLRNCAEQLDDDDEATVDHGADDSES